MNISEYEAPLQLSQLPIAVVQFVAINEPETETDTSEQPRISQE